MSGMVIIEFLFGSTFGLAVFFVLVFRLWEKIPARWPLVWRSTLVQVQAAGNALVFMKEKECERLRASGHAAAKIQGDQIADLRLSLAHADARYSDSETRGLERYAEVQRLNNGLAERSQLVERQAVLLELRQRRIASLEAELAPKHVPEPKKSKLTEAIRDQARQPDGTIDRRLLSHLRGQANILRREGKLGEGEIIQAISQWQTTQDADRPTVEKIVAAWNDGAL